MSHKLGAPPLTETISHYIYSDNLPAYCLFLDAKSVYADDAVNVSAGDDVFRGMAIQIRDVFYKYERLEA